ncbi:hypothetical protein [Paenarthrobacter ilicis]|uniref:hypothetical protein n=1 Tax=Paenarthrobacter ilicis TaxID=43665 RepID=UPI0028D277BC|nr:hypothetical protein [Paenarthrobacter ilicis]
MAGMEIDGSELNDLGDSFAQAASRIIPETRKVVEKGSLNVKKDIQASFRGSSFEGAVRNIRYRVENTEDGIEGSIAPYLEQEGYGSLVGIALYGSSRGGGGTVVDPLVALQAEAPRFEKALSDVVGLVLDE